MASSFDSIKQAINEELKQKDAESAAKAVDNSSEDTPINEKGMPAPTVPGIIGTVVSVPGSEIITLDANTFQLMVCDSVVKKNRKRYCIVEKGVKATFGKQFIDSKGDRTHVLNHDVYNLFNGVLNQVAKQISKLKTENEQLSEKVELQKTTLDALKKHGIIN